MTESASAEDHEETSVEVDPRTPRLRGESFACPYCEAFAQQDWDHLYSNGNVTGVERATCHACGKTSLWLVVEGGILLWPRQLKGGVPAAEDMPAEVRTVYNEARAVVDASPRSAAALLRLALEGLLADLYPSEGNLNDRIGAAAAAGLSQTVVNSMDVLRFNGNAAIHEISREDSADTAASLFAILNLVVERLITEPRRIAQMHAALPPGVLAQIEKRDGASPG
ncbi:DUF4145 domain-containing protein [Nocardioides sp. GXQ0305]|uniref:DUF4145 domain-containing protein n=1 Tax=Nocardioides sp. GXQ0305 TaxID=3423912 RepID=UPI003D7E632F